MSLQKCHSCFTDILKAKTYCDCPTDCKDSFFLEDFVPAITPQTFADIAPMGSGNELAKKLINNNIIKVYSELELIQTNGIQLANKIESACSLCSFAEFTKLSGNVKLVFTNIMSSSNTYTALTRLQIKTNNTGVYNLVLDNGTSPKVVPITLTAGSVIDVPIEYQSKSKTIKVYFEDPTVELYLVECKVKSSCGCGGGASKTMEQNFTIKGEINGVPSDAYYGFMPCVSVGCDPELFICALTTNYKHILARYIALGVAYDIYDMLMASTNMNNTTINTNSDYIVQRMQKLEFEQNEMMYGRKAAHNLTSKKGIAELLQMGMNVNDSCVTCNASVMTFGATF